MTDSDDTQARTVKLEGQIEDLQTQLGDLRKQLAEDALDRWRGRIDDLEVQAHLGSLEAQDRLVPLIEDLRKRWDDARKTLVEGTTTAVDVVATLRHGLDQAMAELRSALMSAKSIASD